MEFKRIHEESTEIRGYQLRFPIFEETSVRKRARKKIELFPSHPIETTIYHLSARMKNSRYGSTNRIRFFSIGLEKKKEKKVSFQKNSRGELNSLGWRTHAPQDFTFPLSRVFSFSRARPSGIRADLYLHLDWISYFPTASLEHRLDYADFWTGRERMHVTFAFPPPAPFLLRRNSGFLVAEDIREGI